MTPEASLPSTPDVSSSVATSGSTPADSSSAPAIAGSPSSADVNTQPVQGEQSQTQEDPFAGLPASEELQQAVEQGTPYAKGLAQVKSAYDALKPQFDELSNKYKPFESFADRFSKPEEVQELIELQDKLFGYERDERNQLIPSTQGAAQYLTEKYPQHADFLAADLLDMPTRDPDTGRVLPRIDLALEAMAEDPVRRANALKILGGVEPSAIAPTWQPTAEELEKVKPELQDIYKGLPYDEREELKLASPEFINRQLEKEKFQQDLMAQNKQAQEREARQQQAREQYVQQQTAEAGNKYVEQGFRQGMTEFTQSIVERSKFIQPLDPQSDAAKQMEPQAVQQMNDKIQRINTGVGKMIATVTAALGHRDTRWIAEDFLKEIGVDDKTIQSFDGARSEFAQNARDYGELNFAASQNPNGQNGNGMGALQSNTTRAMKSMKGYANLVAQPLQVLLSEFFEMKAGSYNQTLNGAAVARPPLNGNAYDPTTAATQRPFGQSREEIYNSADIERLAR